MSDKQQQAEALKDTYVDALVENNAQNAQLSEGGDPGAVPVIPGTGDGDGKGPGKGDGSGKNRALGVSDERAYCIGLHPHPQGECAAGWKCVRSKMGRKVY